MSTADAASPRVDRARAARRGSVIAYAGVALAIVFAFGNGVRAPFLLDDVGSIPANPAIRSFWPPWAPLDAPDQSTVAGRPVVSFTLALDHAIGGLDPRGYHVTNIVLHVCAAWLLLGLLRRSLVASGEGRTAALGTATAVVLLWALHPLQTEAVTYVIQRTELLASTLLLATLAAGDRWMRTRRRRWLVTAGVAAFLGVGSKETMAVAPIAMLLYDRAFVSGSIAEALRRHRALHATLLATWPVLMGVVAMGPRSASVGFDHGISAWEWMLTQSQVLCWYLRLSAWPTPLSLVYDWPIAERLGDVWPAALVVVALLAATGWALLRRPRLGFVAATAFGVLAPSSSFVPIWTEVAAERRMYLPLAALVLLAVLGVRRLARAAGPRASALAATVFAIVAVLAGFGTAARNDVYRSAESIWRDTVEKQPTSALALGHLSTTLRREGRIEEALRYARRAVERTPDEATPHSNLGNLLADRGDLHEALAAYEASLAIDPDYAVAHHNRGLALAQLGEFEAAVAAIERAVAILPEYVDAHANLANLCLRLGDAEGASEHLAAALDLAPEHPQARALLDHLTRGG